MNQDSVKGNPAIEQPEFLFVQITDARAIQHNGRDLTVFEYRVEPLASVFGGENLCSVLYHTERAEHLWERCRQTFGFYDYDAKLAVGRWGKIYLVPSRLEGSNLQYSTVQYVNQTPIDRSKTERLNILAEQDAIPWDAEDGEDAERLIHQALEAARKKAHA